MSAVASRQHNVIRAEQMRMSRAAISRAAASGRLERKYRGVYAWGHLSREGEWLAAVFAAGDGAALASLNAAVLWEISRVRPSGITVAVPSRRRAQPGFELIVGLDPRDVTSRNAIPVTTVARTLLDASRTLAAEQVANLIHEAAFKRRLNLGATWAVLERQARRVLVLERAIAMHLAGSAGTRSMLEDRFLALIRGARFPEPIINTHIHGVEVDFRWGDYCVEVDGPGHLRPATKAADEANQARLEAHGLTVVRFTEAAIDLAPEAVLRELSCARASATSRAAGGAAGTARPRTA